MLRPWVLVLALVCPLEARADEPTRWTWDAIVAELAHHPVMTAARAGLDQLEAKLGQAEWAIFPSFDLDAAITLTPKVTGDALRSHSDWGTIGVYGFVEVTMVQPLWTFGKISEARLAAEAGVEAGNAAIAIAKNDLLVRAAEAYYGRLLALELDAILEEGKGWITKAEARMAKLRAEDSPKYDQSEDLELQVRMADFATLQAKNRALAMQSGQALRLLLREPAGVAIALADNHLDPIPCVLHDAEWYVAAARGHDPVVRAATSNVRVQEHLAGVRDADLLPDLVLLGNAAFARATEIENQPSLFARDPYRRLSAGAALALRWKLDLAQRSFVADEARARAARANAELTVTEDRAELHVRELVQELVNDQELIQVLGKAQRTAQGWLAATWDTYSAGLSPFNDVMDALVQFYQKKFGYLQLVFEHDVTIWRLNQAVGSDVCGP